MKSRTKTIKKSFNAFLQIVGNKAKGWISKRVLQENKASQIFRKMKIVFLSTKYRIRLWIRLKPGLIQSRMFKIRRLNINPFVPNAPFLYPLKTSENLKIFWCFKEVEKGYTGYEWVRPPWSIELNFSENKIYLKCRGSWKRVFDEFRGNRR